MFLVVFALAVQLLIVDQCQSTPLDDYVHAPDPYFNWTLLQTYDQFESTLYVLNFTSQKWFDETFSTRPIWWHYLCITVPKSLIRSQGAFMFIKGGFNTDGVPLPSDEYVALTSLFAESTGSIGVVLHDIPHQPVRFLADPTNQSRDEDAIIAWTWKIYVDNPTNPDVLLQMPMTKAAVRAMDAVQQFIDELNISVPNKFLVAGYSKRGWTTWTAAAVDNERVFAAAPIVMDGINFQAIVRHQFQSLAGLSFALYDYIATEFNHVINSANVTQLLSIVDPYHYFDRYTNTKILQIQGSGDEFFLPDNENLFWEELQNATGGSFLRRIPNADHSLEGSRILLFETIKSFYLSLYDNRTLPSFRWMKSNNDTHGTVQATVDFSVGPAPIKANCYHAYTLTDKRRDFRMHILNASNPAQVIDNPVMWFTSAFVVERPTPTTVVYSLTYANPSSGWKAFFIEVDFPGPHGTVLPLTTETQIIPNTYAGPDCPEDPCPGTLA